MQQNTSNAPQRNRGVFWISILLAVMLLAALAVIFYLARGTFTGQTALSVTPQPTAASERNTAVAAQQSLRNLQKGVAPASIVRADASPGKKIALTMDGLTDTDTMHEILNILKEYDTQVTFYLAGMQAVEAPEVVSAIQSAGHTIGNYTLRALDHMEAMPQEELVEDFAGAGSILGEMLGKTPTQLKCNATLYTEALCQAAAACGIRQVVQSSHFLTYHSFNSYEDVQAYVNKLPYQSILSIKLSGQLDPSEYTPKEIIEDPAIDKQPSTLADAGTDTLPPSERLVRMVRWLMEAIDHTNFDPESETLRQMNDGKLASVIHGLHTTEPAVGYAFYGLGRVDELISVLNALDAVQGTGTFLVTAEEIDKYPEQIALLLERGQCIGLAYYAKKDADYHAVAYELLQARRKLEALDYRSVRLVMQPWGEPSDAVREAASALSCSLIQGDISFAREENRLARTAESAIQTLFKDNPNGFQRGNILAFRMNYFDRSGLLGEVVTALEGTRNAYEIKDIYLISHNTERMYTYPLPESSILPEVRNRLSTGQLRDDFFSRVQERYIGNRDINTRAQLPGFSIEEISQLDKKGTVANEDNAVFLTFDDWGSDVPMTKLLDVLRKHGVKATFFVRTEYVPYNPNLLRAIAVEGHEIGTHTHTHQALAHDPEGKWRFDEITVVEAKDLQQDILTSYQVLQSIIGDVRLENGQPALSTMFRPPTLAVSKTGLEAVLDLGVSYVVAGSYTSQDYKAKSADALAKSLRLNIRSGSVVVLHMSDNSVFTADALDRYLTYNLEREKGKPYTFARLSDYLPTETQGFAAAQEEEETR